MTDLQETGLRVAIAGCGVIGSRRADSMRVNDTLVGCFDIVPARAAAVAGKFDAQTCNSLDELYALGADVVIVATIHSELASITEAALDHGAHVLVEKPAGIGVAQVDRLLKRSIEVGRLVKVGFNHRFHPGIAQAITTARSGIYGDVLYLRGRYGHGGRLGYENEWRADPALSGGGEIVDQGMHLLDLSYWLLGELPLHSALLRTQFWKAPVDDNAVLVLGDKGGVGNTSPFALLHVSWTEWKNTFSLEIVCHDAKLAIDGLVRSYGSQRLSLYKMSPELGPPELTETHFSEEDSSWTAEWRHFADAIEAGDGRDLLGDLASARYAWACIEQAQRS